MAVGNTALWRIRPSGSNTNGGGYDPGISGAATDYSQQNSAQASGTHGTTTGTTTFTDLTAVAFTAAMVGNAMYITGSGQTTGWYFVTAYTSSSVVTLDRSPGTGTLATWALGGGWADFTNCSQSGPLLPGNIAYVLGSGIPNPGSYTYDYSLSSAIASAIGDGTNGNVLFANDPATPGYKAAPDTTGGMPCIKASSQIFNNSGYNYKLQGLWFVGASGIASQVIADGAVGGVQFAYGCVCDQFGYDCSFTSLSAVGCEIFSSVTPGSAGTMPALGIYDPRFAVSWVNNNIHDCVGLGISGGGGATELIGNIIAKCQSHGVQYYGGGPGDIIMGNTIDGNLGNGIYFTHDAYGTPLGSAIVFNNIISNHTQSGMKGLLVYDNTIAQNNRCALFCDYNVYYNNATDVSNISYGAHDTHGGSNPYVNQSTENYTLA